MSMEVDVPRLLDELGIEARRKGRYELWAPCPFHDEEKPSWEVRDQPGHQKHGYHRCFGCHAGGGVMTLVRHVLGRGLGLPGDVDGRTAYRWLRERGLAGEPALPPALTVEVSDAMRPARRFRMPGGVLFEPLASWPEPVRRYALSRGVTAHQVDRWGLGWGLDGRLAGRVVFPVYDGAGMLVSYVARAFAGQELRYRTPDLSEGPACDAILGEHLWPQQTTARRLVVVTEGGLNALACEVAPVASMPTRDQGFVNYAVGAVLGSELFPQQAGKFATFRRVLVASDPDPAGDDLWDKLRASLGRWCSIARVPIPREPAGLDCQALGPRALAQAIEEGLRRLPEVPRYA